MDVDGQVMIEHNFLYLWIVRICFAIQTIFCCVVMTTDAFEFGVGDFGTEEVSVIYRDMLLAVAS